MTLNVQKPNICAYIRKVYASTNTLLETLALNQYNLWNNRPTNDVQMSTHFSTVRSSINSACPSRVLSEASVQQPSDTGLGSGCGLPVKQPFLHNILLSIRYYCKREVSYTEVNLLTFIDRLSWRLLLNRRNKYRTKEKSSWNSL